MSQQNSAPAIPDSQTAYQNLFDGVHTQIFFQKLASAYGYTPRDDAEAAEMLKLAGKLRFVEEQTQQQKQASDSPFAIASAHLDQVLGARGMDGHVKQAHAQEQEWAARSAARAAMQSPVFYNSVLSLKAAEAQQVATQLGAA